MKLDHFIRILLVLLIVCFAATASAEWLFQGTDAADLRLMESHPEEESAVLFSPAGHKVTARIQDEIGAEGMTLIEIGKSHIILEKDKNKLRLLRQPDMAGRKGATTGLAIPPGPPSN